MRARMLPVVIATCLVIVPSMALARASSPATPFKRGVGFELFQAAGPASREHAHRRPRYRRFRDWVLWTRVIPGCAEPLMHSRIRIEDWMIARNSEAAE